MEIKRLFYEDVDIYWEELCRLMDLCYEVSFEGPVPEMFSRLKLNELKSYLQKDQAYLFGAIDGNQMYGFLWCHGLSTVQGRVFHVAYGGVDPTAVGHGLFTKMMAKGEETASEDGYHISELRVAKKNPLVIDIHTKHGYQTEDVIMRKKLKKP